MTWTKLDDNFDTNPKIMIAIGVVGDVAGWAWVRAVNYCNRHLTDGFIPRDVVPTLMRHRKPFSVAQALVDSGAWLAVNGGFEIHDFLQWNDSRSKVLASRTAAKLRKDAWTERNRNASNERSENAPGTPPERHRNAVPNASQKHPRNAAEHFPLRSDPDLSTETSGAAAATREPRATPEHHQAPPVGISPQGAEVFAELKRHRRFVAIATPELAEDVAAHGIGAMKRLPDIIRAIGEAHFDTPDGWSEQAMRKQLRVYVAGANPRKAGGKPPAQRGIQPGPDDPTWDVPEAARGT